MARHFGILVPSTKNGPRCATPSLNAVGLSRATLARHACPAAAG